jgi:hypothetical protein
VERRRKAEEDKKEGLEEDKEMQDDYQDADFEEEEYTEAPVRDWFETKKVGSVFLKITVSNKSRQSVKYTLKLKHEDENNFNVMIP